MCFRKVMDLFGYLIKEKFQKFCLNFGTLYLWDFPTKK